MSEEYKTFIRCDICHEATREDDESIAGGWGHISSEYGDVGSIDICPSCLDKPIRTLLSGDLGAAHEIG